mmetsp:Transcript_28373/g.87784  ORF Transcript_28373/g.87784 Transcript_28373/m.87784 type:complete len:134 (-) Transcript_28373:426-827(-)
MVSSTTHFLSASGESSTNKAGTELNRLSWPRRRVDVLRKKKFTPVCTIFEEFGSFFIASASLIISSHLVLAVGEIIAGPLAGRSTQKPLRVPSGYAATVAPEIRLSKHNVNIYLVASKATLTPCGFVYRPALA